MAVGKFAQGRGLLVATGSRPGMMRLRGVICQGVEIRRCVLGGSVIVVVRSPVCAMTLFCAPACSVEKKGGAISVLLASS